MLSLSQYIQKVNSSSYKLDLSGVVGLLGGDNAVDALETIHLYAGRRWAGWYNYPGAITVARRFGQMADNRFWDSLFPGPNDPPAIAFNLAGENGPEYSGSFSGTKLCTNYLGYLIAQECSDRPGPSLELFDEHGNEGRKTGSSAAVTVISLPRRQHERILRSRAMTPPGVTNQQQKNELIPVTPKRDLFLLSCALIPSLVSILACVFCFLCLDYLCASLILFGIVSSGLSSIALGTAAVRIRVPVPSPSSPPGDGLMTLADGSIIVLKGQEADVNIITKGEFELDYSAGILPHPKHHTIGVCALLLLTQCLLQLLLTPLCTLFGQILFLVSFVASEAYHLYMVSRQREVVHRELLCGVLSPQIDKRVLGTRTQMAVFACLALGEGHLKPLTSKPDEVLQRIIPNETPVWKYWRRKVVKELANYWGVNSGSSTSIPNYKPSIRADPEGATETNEHEYFSEDDKGLLRDLICDAWCVFKKYPSWREAKSNEQDDLGEDKFGLSSRISLV